MPTQSARIVLAILGLPSEHHDGQCTVAEHSAYFARVIIAQMDIAAEGRNKKPRPNINGVDSDEGTDGEVVLKLQLGIGSEACLGMHPWFDA